MIKDLAIFAACIALLCMMGYVRADDSARAPSPQPSPNVSGEGAPSRWWVTPGAVSYHANRAAKYNELNYGIGVEYAATPRVSLMLGMYENSIRQTTHYALAKWLPLGNGRVRAGIVGGLVDGYRINDGGITPALAPVVSIEWRHVGLNIMVIPGVAKHLSTALAVQVKFR